MLEGNKRPGRNSRQYGTFIIRQRQLAHQHSFTTTADPSNLQGKQLVAYNLVKHHMESNHPTPLRMIISGTAGTGKSYLIHCLWLLLHDKVCVVRPTGVSAFNIHGHTLHSLLHLPTKAEFKDLQGEPLNKLQQSLAGVNYCTLSSMRCLWWVGSCLDKWTDDYARNFLIIPINP